MAERRLSGTSTQVAWSSLLMMTVSFCADGFFDVTFFSLLDQHFTEGSGHVVEVIITSFSSENAQASASAFTVE